MKRIRRLFACLVYTLLVCTVTAQTYPSQSLKFWVDDAMMTADGKTVTTLTFYENDTLDYCAFNLSVYLPYGVSIAQVKSGRKYVNNIALTERAEEDHVIACNMPTGKLLKIGSYSATNSNYYNTDEDDNPMDALFTIGLIADPCMVNGDYEVTITGVKFILSNAVAYVPQDPLSFTLTVKGGHDTSEMPQVGTPYRLKGAKSGKYLTAESAGSTMSMTDLKTETTIPTVFVPTSEGKLLSYGGGFYTANIASIGKLGSSNTWYYCAGTTDGSVRCEGAAGTSVSWLCDVADSVNTEGVAVPCVKGLGSYDATRCDWTFEAVENLPVRVTSAGYATLYSPWALTIPQGVKAYVGTLSGDRLNLTALDGVIPPNTGVVIEAAQGVYEFPLVADEVASQTSSLIGQIEAQTAPTAGTVFTLQQIDGKVGLYRYNGTAPIPGFKAFLHTDTGLAVNGFAFEKDDATGINVTTLDINQTDKAYDLSGRRVKKDERGLHIVNGRKVISNSK